MLALSTKNGSSARSSVIVCPPLGIEKLTLGIVYTCNGYFKKRVDIL